MKIIYKILIFAVLLLIIQGIILVFQGHALICNCGYIKFWEGNIFSAGNSQHLSDWYSFSHILHGFILYFLLWLIFPKMPVKYRFLIALGLEIGWEVFENSPFLVEAYRQQALAKNYMGDSVLNSISDSLFMILGFLGARFFPAWATITIAILLEIWTGIAIRDNLTLNILNFIYKFDFIQRWQTRQ